MEYSAEEEEVKRIFGKDADCDYLVKYETVEEEEASSTAGYIVFIDHENDIDWKIQGGWDKEWNQEDKKAFICNISKLNVAEKMPCPLLRFNTVRAYKILLGQGVSQCCCKCFEGIDDIIRKADDFRRERNMEAARMTCLLSGSVFVMMLFGTLVAMMLTDFLPDHFLLCKTLFCASLGAFVSIWTRYGKVEMTGESPRSLLVLETTCRIVVGMISGFVAMKALETGMILKTLYENNTSCTVALVAFCAGFSERFIPSITEQVQKKE
ncbi:hypothetical protein [Palleniella muris]|uniref:hypothetical protein n=1 Tax=Palleniella muris TaxID=3038145 RepID=UPI001093C064|nr:hypothetical protein [Palleniella muris]